MIDPGLCGRVALVTGANHGIGAATARALAAQGARVFATAHRVPAPYSERELDEAQEAGVPGMPLYRAQQRAPLQALLDAIRASGGEAVGYEVDLADAAAIPELFARCERTLGPVEVLVINHTHCVLETFDPALAGEGREDPRLPTAEVIDAHFRINARAAALLMAEFVQRHVARDARWGRIVALSTDAAHAHVANISYAASKHAIESYARSAAAEVGRYGVTVNVVAPGPIQTGYISPEQVAEIAAGTPLGRVGEPEDVADAIVFLASEQARWLTGQLLYVGGGWRMPQ